MLKGFFTFQLDQDQNGTTSEKKGDNLSEINRVIDFHLKDFGLCFYIFGAKSIRYLSPCFQYQ